MRKNFKKKVVEKTLYGILKKENEGLETVKLGELDGDWSLRELEKEILVGDYKDCIAVITGYLYGTYEFNDEIIKQYGRKI